MTTDRYVEQAADWAQRLTAKEAAGYGDTEGAMRRLARRLGLRSWRDLWTLRYRPPARIFADVYVPLERAWKTECARLERQCEEEKRLAEEAKAQALRTWGLSEDEDK